MRTSEITGRGGMRNFNGVRGIVSWVDGNLRRSDFDISNFFQSYKQESANIDHWLKSKSA